MLQLHLRMIEAEDDLTENDICIDQHFLHAQISRYFNMFNNVHTSVL